MQRRHSSRKDFQDFWGDSFHEPLQVDHFDFCQDFTLTPDKSRNRKLEPTCLIRGLTGTGSCRTSEVVIYTARPMALWTVIADFRGGTYISQFLSTSARAALVKWATSLPRLPGSFIGPRTRLKLLAAVRDEDERIVSIQATRNVWYWRHFRLRFVVHLVKTSRD